MLETTLHRLRIFKIVTDAGSINAAARQLQITQPSVSSHIQALEQEIGRKLFIRHQGRRMELTDAGKLLHDYASEVIARTSQFEHALMRLDRKEKTVSVAAQRNIANNLMPQHLAKFSRTHPDYEIIMYSQTYDTVIGHVREGKADLGLIITTEYVEGLYSEILDYQRLMFVVGPGHELAKKPLIEPEELERHSFISAIKHSKHARMIDELMQKIGVRHHRFGLQVEDSATMIELVKRGVGYAATFHFSVKEELERGELVSLPINAQPISLEFRLLYNPEIRLSDEARLFMVFLRHEIHSMQQK
jgi:molybdate transport repressor ModE-like protein